MLWGLWAAGTHHTLTLSQLFTPSQYLCEGTHELAAN